MPRAYSPAFTTWQRQPMDVPPQQSMSSALIAQGTLPAHILFHWSDASRTISKPDRTGQGMLLRQTVCLKPDSGH